MFDISFSELMVIAVVALIVIGPEKLPKVARTAGAFFGRMQRFVAQVKDEINREARFAELQHLQQEVQSSLQQGLAEVEQSILPPKQSGPVTIEGEASMAAELPPAKKPRAKKIATADMFTTTEAVDEPTPKPVRKRKASATQAPNPIADETADKPAVIAKPRKPRTKKAAAASSKDIGDF